MSVQPAAELLFDLLVPGRTERFELVPSGSSRLRAALIADGRVRGHAAAEDLIGMAYLLDQKHESPTAAHEVLEVVAEVLRCVRAASDKAHVAKRIQLSKLTGRRIARPSASSDESPKTPLSALGRVIPVRG